jgi:hypothetical protein
MVMAPQTNTQRHMRRPAFPWCEAEEAPMSTYAASGDRIASTGSSLHLAVSWTPTQPPGLVRPSLRRAALDAGIIVTDPADRCVVWAAAPQAAGILMDDGPDWARFRIAAAPAGRVLIVGLRSRDGFRNVCDASIHIGRGRQTVVFSRACQGRHTGLVLAEIRSVGPGWEVTCRGDAVRAASWTDLAAGAGPGRVVQARACA